MSPESHDGKGPRLAPGVPIELGELRLEQRHVHGVATGVEFDGWVPDDAVGTVFQRSDFPMQADNLAVAQGYEIYAEGADGGLGPAIAGIPREDLWSPVWRVSAIADTPAGAPHGFRLIHIVTPAIDVRGLILSAALSPIESYCGCCWGGFSRPFVRRGKWAAFTLRAGASIYDSDDQLPVGVALRQMTVYGDVERGDMVHVSFGSRLLGGVHAMVLREDLGDTR
jgi:hypothetical protein